MATKKKKVIHKAPQANKAAPPPPEQQQAKYTISIEELRKRKLLIATPMYGGQCTGPYTDAVLKVAAECVQHGITLETRFHYNESLIQRARNYLVDEFMRSDCTHLMFIDADIAFNPRDVLALLALTGPKEDRLVMCGLYPKKQIYWDRVQKAVEKQIKINNPNELAMFAGGFAFNLLPGTTQFSLTDPVQIMEGATGFMMCHRSVFEKFDEAYPEYKYFPDHKTSEHFNGSRKISAYFHCDIDRGYDIGDIKRIIENENIEAYSAIKELLDVEKDKSLRYLSEDYWFSRKLQDIGVAIWACPWMQLAHVGSLAFQGSLAALSAVQTNPN